MNETVTRSELFESYDVEFVIETALKLNETSLMLENALQNNDLRFLLYEELDKKDIEKLRKTTQDAIKAIQQITGAVGDKIPSLKKPLDSLMKASKSALKFTSELDLENPEGLMANIGRFFGGKIDVAQSLQSVLQIQTKTKQLTDSLENTIPIIIKNIQDFMDPTTQGDTPLEDIAGEGEAPSADKLKQGVLKAFKAGAKSGGGGLLGKVVGFLRKAAGKSKLLQGIVEPDPKKIADDILKLSAKELMDMRDALNKAKDVEGVDKATMKDISQAEPEDYKEVAKDSGGEEGAAVENPDKAEKREDFKIEDLIALLKKMQPAAAKAIEAMPEEQQEEVIADDAEAIAAGEVSPEEAVEAVAEEAEEAEAAPGFSGIAKKFVDDLKGRGLSDEGETFVKAYLQNLKDSETFRQIAGTKLNMEDSYFRGSVSSYLFEEIEFDELAKASDAAADFKNDEESGAVSGFLADVMADAGVEVKGDNNVELTDDIIAGLGKEEPKIKPEVGDIFKYTTNKGKETFVKVVEVDGDDGVIVNSSNGKGGFRKNKFRLSLAKLGDKSTPEEAGVEEAPEEEKGEEKEKEKEGEEKVADPEKESSPEEEIKAAPRDTNPSDAIMKSLEDWESSLSASSRETINRKNRLQSLKDVINTSLDGAGERAKKHVASAIKKWRGANEEPLIKSKRFAKKNFDSLQSLIPALVAAIIAKKTESSSKYITVSSIHKTVNMYLNRKFYGTNILLSEVLFDDRGTVTEESNNFDLTKSQTSDEAIERWKELAGI